MCNLLTHEHLKFLLAGSMRSGSMLWVLLVSDAIFWCIYMALTVLAAVLRVL